MKKIALILFLPVMLLASFYLGEVLHNTTSDVSAQMGGAEAAINVSIDGSPAGSYDLDYHITGGPNNVNLSGTINTLDGFGSANIALDEGGGYSIVVSDPTSQIGVLSASCADGTSSLSPNGVVENVTIGAGTPTLCSFSMGAGGIFYVSPPSSGGQSCTSNAQIFSVVEPQSRRPGSIHGAQPTPQPNLQP